MKTRAFTLLIFAGIIGMLCPLHRLQGQPAAVGSVSKQSSVPAKINGEFRAKFDPGKNHPNQPGFTGTGDFLENKGQVLNQFHQPNRELLFLWQGPGMNVQLKKNSFSYDTYTAVAKPVGSGKTDLLLPTSASDESIEYNFHRVDIDFPGANPSPVITAEDATSGYISYYTPHYPAGISTLQYRRVRYSNLYPGIDLVFESRDIEGKACFEYYFLVKPGADAGQLRLQYKGADTRLINNRIVIQTASGRLEERIPWSATSNSPTIDFRMLAEKPGIAVTYQRLGNGTYSFKIPSYDRSQTLVIDPTPDLVWGTYYGGSHNDVANCIARNNDGSVVIGGGSGSTNLATSGAYQSTLLGFADGMIGKFQSDGSLLWITYFGGEQSDEVFGICTDDLGNIFVAGITDSKTGVTTPGSHQPAHANPGEPTDRDAFLARFSSNGQRIWATYYGGDGVDYLHSIRLDAAGNLYVAGWTHSQNGIASTGAFQQAYASNISDPQALGDGFVARFSTDGMRIWGSYFGGTDFDRFYNLAVDNAGNIYAAGITASNGLATTGAFQANFSGLRDGLIVKLNKDGQLLWSTYYGGTGLEYVQAIACDNQGNIIAGGATGSTSGISSGAVHQPGYAGSVYDGFIVKFNAVGSRIWGTYYGGEADELIFDVCCDNTGNIYTCGTSSSSTGIATPNSYQPAGGGGAVWATFWAKLTPAGTRSYGTYYGKGGLASGEARGLVTDNNGSVFVCGATISALNIATCTAIQKNLANNNYDMFISMFSEASVQQGLSVSVITDHPAGACAGESIQFAATALHAGNLPVYQWKVNGIASGSNNPVFVSSQLKNGDQVTCTVTSNGTCIVSQTVISNTITVVILPPLLPAVTISASVSGVICPGSTAIFTAIITNGGNAAVYQWKINGVNTGPADSVFTTSSLADGDVVTCELTNNASCNPVKTVVSNAIPIRVASVVVPTISITASEQAICSGETVSFMATSQNAGNRPAYQWKVNGMAAGTGQAVFSALFSDRDTIQCFVRPDSASCAAKQDIASNKIGLQVFSLPDFKIQPAAPVIQKGDTLSLSLTGSNMQSFEWSPGLNISNSSVPAPLVWPQQTTVYTVMVSSDRGCKSSKQVTVTVISGIHIPSAFTPNYDGLNDRWVIHGLETYPDCRVTVYNRWGQVVFESLGYAQPWDGRSNNQLLQTGVYVYRVDPRSGVSPIVGTVTIIR